VLNSVVRSFRRVVRRATDDREAATIRSYEATQRRICATAGARFDPPDYEKLVALAPSVVDGHRPVRGTRHVGETIDWWVIAEDEARPAVEDMALEHLHHIATIRDDLVMYLALPLGWSFVLLGDEARTWAAFSPADRLEAHVEEFLAGPTPDEAGAIRDILNECFADEDRASELAARLSDYITGRIDVGEIDPDLRRLPGGLRGSAGDGRAPSVARDL
jgi:hypothetical protein